MSRITKMFSSRQISWSQLRLEGLDIDVETKSRNVDKDFSAVETNFLKMPRISQLLRRTFWKCRDWGSHCLNCILTMLRQIETPKLAINNNKQSYNRSNFKIITVLDVMKNRFDPTQHLRSLHNLTLIFKKH